jgi:thiol-disulfide isomerase/thioredoxin
MNLKQVLINKFIRGRKPLSIAGDVFFFGFLLMLLIPSTRSIILSGVAVARTWITNPEIPESQRVALSDEAWGWNLIDPQGKVVPFDSFRGEVIFLNQWATWCPPCRAEMPAIEKLFRATGNKVKFVILTAEDPQKVRQFIEKEGYTFPVYIGSVEGPELAARSIPSTVIIDRTGKIVVNRKGAFNWNSGKIRKLLVKLSAL